MVMYLSRNFNNAFNIVTAHAAISCGTAADDGYRVLKALLLRNDARATVTFVPTDNTKPEVALDIRDFMQDSPADDSGFDIDPFSGKFPDEREKDAAAYVAATVNNEATGSMSRVTGIDMLLAAIAMVAYAIENGGILAV